MDRLRISVEGEPPVIRLIGEVDMANADELRSCLKQVRLRGFPLSLELSELRFIDSNGIRVLLTEAVAMEGQTPLVLKNPSPIFMKVLKIINAFDVSNLEIVIE